MNPFFQRIIIENVRRRRKQLTESELSITRYAMAREFFRLRVSAIRWAKDIILITAGILSAGFGLESFLLPNDFIDGGVTGISLLTSEVSGWSLPILIVCINVPFMILGYQQIGRNFAIKSIAAIVGLAVVIATVHYPIITSDKLLVAVFGGFFLGAGIGLSVRGGGVLDGTEVLAIFISKRIGVSIGDVILLFNIVIFSVAAYLLTIETALYSILTYMAASKTVDFIIEGIEEYTGVTIVSSHSDEIREMIIDKMGRGVTIYTGKRGYGKRGNNPNPIDIVYTVITRLEIAKLKAEVETIDKDAFVVMNSIKDMKGGMIKKRPLDH